MTEAASPILFVPIVLTEEQAYAAFNATRAVFTSLNTLGQDNDVIAPLAQAMYEIGKAIDKARGMS